MFSGGVDQFRWNPTTQHTRINVIVTAFNWAVKMGIRAANPIAKMEKPRPNVRQEFVPADQWPKLLAACKPDLQDFLTVILDAEARVQEMFVYEARHFDGSRLTLSTTDSKGRRKSRVVNLPPVSLEIVKRLATQSPSGKLFRTRRNTVGTEIRFATVFSRAQASHGHAEAVRHHDATFVRLPSPDEQARFAHRGKAGWATLTLGWWPPAMAT